MKNKPFTCRGCGERKTPDGNPKNAAFVWTDTKTKTRRPYCYDCDDKLIQDAPLPRVKRTRK
jgi:hypothetical protein